ncbi:CRE-CATP-7 protein, partial [Caenorhabditis remanei]
FIAVLAGVAAFGFLYTSFILFYRGSSFFKIFIRALDLVTIVVPPALPAVMGIGIFYAQRRLRQKSIYCISPTTINTCGAIDVVCVCFDKTGTLTEDGLDFYALRVVENAKIGENIVQISTNETCQNVVRAIATCHTLSKINHELHGDPLDVIMFEQTRYSLEEDDSESHESIESIQPILIRPPKDSTLSDCQIVKQFTFSSGLQRQSVIVTDEDSMKAYCKGSPEMIMSLCRPETVPENFHDIVEEYSQHGYRLIAVAEKDLVIGSEVQKTSRQSIECDLTLIGLVALENRLKPVTTEVIQKLNEANIRSVMVTGDNLLTALSVARECGIIISKKTAYLIEHENGVVDKRGRTILTIREKGEHHTQERQSKSVDLSKMSNVDCQFAISGSTFSVVTHEYPELLDQLVCVCNVFARMAPEQKQLLVEHLQEVGQTVAMCGDGANDCAALKAAHAGISLSEAEASIAAPFTSKVADIRCVITLISEGRAALVTSYSAFLCMAGYSLTQFISILLLYWIATSYSQMQFLFIDIAIVTNLAFLSSQTRAHKGLASTPPPTSILSTASMVSLFGQLAIGGMAQIGVFCLITMQEWFKPFQPTHHDNDEDRKSLQGTAIFYVSLFHYIVLYFVFAAGPPYRASITSNKAFLMSMICVTIGCIAIVVFYFTPIQYFLGCLFIPQQFRFIILCIALITAIVSILYDRCVDWISLKISEKIRQMRKGA